MRHLALIALLSAATAAQGATELTFGLAQGVSAVQTPQRTAFGVAAAFDLQAQRQSDDRVLTLGLAGELDAEGDAAGTAALSFAHRGDGWIAAFDLSHQRLAEVAFDPAAILTSPRSTTRSRFEFGRAAGAPVDWAFSGAIVQEQSDEGEASGHQLGAEIGLSPRPARRVALRLGHEQRGMAAADMTYKHLGLSLQAHRPRGRDEARLGARTTPDGARLSAGVATHREMPRGGALGVEIGLAKTAEGAILPVGDVDLRLGLSRQSRLSIEAGHHVIDDPLRGEIGDLRFDLRASHRPTRLTSVEFGLGAFHRDPLDGTEADRGLRASAGVSRALTRDWSLVAEVDHRRMDTERASETHRSELSIMLERRFEGSH